MNPFLDEYVRKEAQFYGLETPIKEGRLSVISHGVSGLTPCLFHNEIRVVSTKLLNIPAMFLDNSKLIFSLTPFHLQGYYLPIQRATGRVLCLGLGMGYFVLRASQKPEVTEVVVVEQSQEIIDFFKRHFNTRSETRKIRIVHGDTYSTETHLRVGKDFDFCLCSIYPVLYSDESIRDVPTFMDVYGVKQYHFFGMERLIMECMGCGLLRRYDVSIHLREFINLWKTMGHRFQPILKERILRAFSLLALRKNLLQW